MRRKVKPKWKISNVKDIYDKQDHSYSDTLKTKETKGIRKTDPTATR